MGKILHSDQTCHDIVIHIVKPLRTSLNIETIAALLFINCVGPPLMKFKPEKYVRSWLAKDTKYNRHSADDTTSRKRGNILKKINSMILCNLDKQGMNRQALLLTTN
ncbi:hypothetical protein RI129_002993 [Pyrocoelia pectoralis]|uniref:Uncharacterized protein n=1 Tax=Pyrocoelia pectoralis TaxID=417401 RepID=A0AAN7VMZ8_9COLE